MFIKANRILILACVLYIAGYDLWSAVFGEPGTNSNNSASEPSSIAPGFQSEAETWLYPRDPQ